jgi:hypothetical protein
MWLLLLVATALAAKNPVVAEIGPLEVTAEEVRSASVRSRGDQDEATYRKELLEGILDRHAAFLRVRDDVLARDPAAKKIWADAFLAKKYPTGDYHYEPEEIYAYWEAHKADFTRPAELNWQWVLVRITPERPRDEAKQLAEELRTIGDEQPEWLANAVREIGSPTVTIAYSKVKATGNLDGIAGIAFAVPETEIVSEIVERDGGFGFVRLVDRYDAVERDWEEAQRDVRRAMIADARDQAADAYLKKILPADVYADPARKEAAATEALYEEALKAGLDEDASVQRKVVNRWLDLEGIQSNGARKDATARLAKEGRERFPPEIDEAQLAKVPLRSR